MEEDHWKFEIRDWTMYLSYLRPDAAMSRKKSCSSESLVMV